jgi:hypothetical protein
MKLWRVTYQPNLEGSAPESFLIIGEDVYDVLTRVQHHWGRRPTEVPKPVYGDITGIMQEAIILV